MHVLSASMAPSDRLIFANCRSRLLPNAFDDDKLRQKMSYLLEFRGKLDEEKWRAGVDVKLIFAYFKFLLEYLMSQATVSATQIADFKDQLSSNHDTKTSLLESRSEVDSLTIENMVLSTFLDQLTEESGSCQSRSAQTKPESHGRTDISKVSLLCNLGSCYINHFMTISRAVSGP